MVAAEQVIFKDAESRVYVAVAGSRDYPDRAGVEAFIDVIPQDYVVVSGCAKGVDTWAAERARTRGMEVVEVHPKMFHGMSVAAKLRERTRRVVAMSDYVVAFRYNFSPGTTYAIQCALELSKPLCLTDLP